MAPPKVPGTRAQTLKAGAACGAKKRHGGTCTLAAGWGTNHPGIGKCKLHGGSTPNQVKAAAKDEYRKLLGTPIEINPLDALIMCIKIRAGEIQWLSNEMAKLDRKHWIEDTMVGKQFHLFARERTEAMKDLARFSQMAISLGIAERAVKLAEVYGETIAQLLNGILNELKPHMDEEGIRLIPQIVRKHLLLIEGSAGQPQVREQPALPARSAA